MGKTLIVENLAPDMDEEGLRAAFAEHGKVANAEITRDPETGESCGFGIVEMENDEEADSALGAMDDQEAEGLTVTDAGPPARQPPPVSEPFEPL